MIQTIIDFFDSSRFMPHGHCFLWQNNIFWLHVISDATIAAAYFAIPFMLLYLLHKRKDMPFETIFLCFAAFILFCGATHVMSIWVLWHPDYAIEGVLKALTAFASISTLFIGITLIPRILAIPSPSQLAAVNEKLIGATKELELHYTQRQASSDSYLKAVVNTVLDGLITIDSVGTIQSFNLAAVRIFSYQPTEIIGHSIAMLLPEPYHQEVLNYLKYYNDTAEAKTLGRESELFGQRKNGTIFPMEVGINAMQVDGSRTFVATIRDITQRQESEREIQQYLTALKRSNQELDDFAYIASHDLKEPLRGLSNNALFLKEDYGDRLDESAHHRIGRMTYLCERMERLVNDLLYFSRLGRQELAVQRTDLNEVIQDIESMMESSLQEANATIRIIDRLPTITCDLPRITEVYRNLITNAIKYNDKTVRTVEIGSEVCVGERIFYVRDNGIGIPIDFYSDVFRIFKRLNDEDDSIKGTGVGLTFVKKIIERHHGRIWIESLVGTGTTFFFTLHESKGR